MFDKFVQSTHFRKLGKPSPTQGYPNCFMHDSERLKFPDVCVSVCVWGLKGDHTCFTGPVKERV
jgi:hypothetical protein